MKEDILEQLVDDYLQFHGYFTRHNIKFRPDKKHKDFNSKADSVHSDIDILAIHPKKLGHDKVVVVSCKSWQGGFDTAWILRQLTNKGKISGKDAWKTFRELMIPKWSQSLLDAVWEATGTRKFKYITAVTLVKGNRNAWEHHKPFLQALQGNPLQILDLEEILLELKKSPSTTPASSAIGRMLQLMRPAEKGKAALDKALARQKTD